MLDSDNNDDEWRDDHGEGRLNSGWFFMSLAAWGALVLVFWIIWEAFQ